MDESAAWYQACSLQSRSEPALPSLSHQLPCQGLQAGTGLPAVPGTGLGTVSAHRIFLPIGRFSQGLNCRAHSLSQSTPAGILAWATCGAGGRPLPGSELLSCLKALTATTGPSQDPRSCPDLLDLSFYLKSLTSILASPRSWPPVGPPVTLPVPGALTLPQPLSWAMP